MNENEFEHEGKTFEAIEKAKSMSRCTHFAFDKTHDCLDPYNEIPSCDEADRTDGRRVIFVEKQSC